MKINFTLRYLFLACLVVLAGCDKDDDPKPNDFILGNWNISDTDFEIKVGTKTLVEYYVSQGMTQSEAELYAGLMITVMESAYTGDIEFKSDGTYKAVSGSDTQTGKWELSADGKTLTTDKGTADEAAFTVVSHTATVVNLTHQFQETEDGETYSVKLDMELTKK